MERLKLMLTGGLLVLALSIAVTVTFLAMSQLDPVQADAPNQPVVTTPDEGVEYLPLTDAQPQRDITRQRFAPLETAQ
jgi:hypothetical protein